MLEFGTGQGLSEVLGVIDTFFTHFTPKKLLCILPSKARKACLVCKLNTLLLLWMVASSFSFFIQDFTVTVLFVVSRV